MYLVGFTIEIYYDAARSYKRETWHFISRAIVPNAKHNNCHYGLLICSNEFVVRKCRRIASCLSSTQRVSHHFFIVFWKACSFGTGEFTYFSSNTAIVSMNNLVSMEVPQLQHVRQ